MGQGRDRGKARDEAPVGAGRRAWLAGGAALVGLAAFSGACGHAWDDYDPRLGDASGASSSSSGTGGAGGAGGAGGMAGAGGATACEPGTTMSCYAGPTGTQDIGACKAGEATCAADGSSYGPCTGEVLPAAEACEITGDEDCNGAMNDHCASSSEQFGGSGEQRILAVAMDDDGNYVIAGRAVGAVNFGGGSLAAAGGFDAFVAKFNATGAHLWSKRFGGTGADEALGVAMDGTGHVYVTGSFSGSVSFGGTPLVAEGLDAFVVAYEPDGTYIGEVVAGGAGDQVAHAIASDAAGNVVLAGSFTVGINGIVTATATAAHDGFAVRLDPTGEVIWAKAFGSTGEDEAFAVAFDGLGNAVVAGKFDEEIDFGAGPILDTTGGDAFVVKIDATGKQLYARVYGGTLNQAGHAVAADAAGNVVVAGSYTGELDDGTQKFLDPGSTNMFVSKIDPLGNVAWTRGYGDAAEQLGLGVAIGGAGNVFVTGALQGSVDFGDGLPLVVDGGDAMNDDVFLLSLSPSGALRFARRFGDANDQDGRAVAASAAGVLLVGEMDATIDFGDGPHATSTSDDAFVARFEP
jgi:hypothetical protein